MLKYYPNHAIFSFLFIISCGVGFIANTSNGPSGTNKVLDQGLTALSCMEHRGACGGDGVSGDGAGIMTAIPWNVFENDYRSESCAKPGVGMVFLPQDEDKRIQVKEVRARRRAGRRPGAKRQQA